MKAFILALVIILSASFVSAQAPIHLEEVYCNAEGAIGFKAYPDAQFGTATDLTVLLKSPGSSKFDVIEGEWDRNTIVWDEFGGSKRAQFKGYEAEVANAGEYELELGYRVNNVRESVNLFVTCPGTEFSCRLFQVEVEYCGSNDGTFTAVYNLGGMDSYKEYDQVRPYNLDDYKFQFTAQDRYCDNAGSCARTAGLPFSSVLKKIDDERYELTWEYDTIIKTAGVTAIPGEVCKNNNYDYAYSFNDFTTCDPDPYYKEFVCDGCEAGAVCIPEGTKVVQEGVSLYCVNGELSPQLPTGSNCDEAVECITGLCVEGVCVDEKLPACGEGRLQKACVCGNAEVLDISGKYCCNGEVSNSVCPNDTEEVSECSEGFELVDGECVKTESEGGFWNAIANFFKGLFKSR